MQLAVERRSLESKHLRYQCVKCATSWAWAQRRRTVACTLAATSDVFDSKGRHYTCIDGYVWHNDVHLVGLSHIVTTSRDVATVALRNPTRGTAPRRSRMDSGREGEHT